MMRAVVIGGGITGLAAAHRLTELARERGIALELQLLEAGDRVGGAIATERREGFLLEAGPDSFITDKPWALALCRRIGLAERLIGTNDAHRRSYVVRGGKLHPVPEGFQLLAPSRFGPLATSRIFSWPGKLRMAMDLVLPARKDSADESIGAFVERRLGREALERMAQPMVGGIYGADPYALSLQATLPRFREMERRHGSLIRAMWAARRRSGVQVFRSSGVQADRAGTRTPEHPNTRTPEQGVSGARYGLFVSLDGGMQVLVDALTQRLPPGTLTLGARVTHLERHAPDTSDPQATIPSPPNAQRLTPNAYAPWRVTLADGASITADAVCVALPAYRAAALVERVDADLAARLLAIPYASAATVNLAYRRADVPHALDGFGFVVPAREERAILGCTFSSVKFPGRAPDGHALLRAFLGGPGVAQASDAEMEAAVRDDLRLLLGIRAAPMWVSAALHPNAMAHYTVGHLDRVAEIEDRVTRLPGLALAGNAYRGIGIPDCVHSGEQAAEALLTAC
jgi:oxygen-dependent protoporphyrinogen oxidase